MASYTNHISGWEGIGSQFLIIIRAILYTEIHGGHFAYTEPSWSNVYSKEEASAVNNMINIKDNYPDAVPYSIVIDRPLTYSFVDSHTDMCYNSPSMGKIKKLFFEKNSTPFGDGFHVVVHIRRPSSNPNIDIPSMNTCGGEVKHLDDFSVDQTDRFTSDGYFLKIIESIRKTHPSATFHICSDGHPELFKNFIADDTVFHINEPVVPTFQMMVFSNILITSKSTFSYTAALFNPNEVRYTRCWHTPVTHWIS
jgi:hypothetical protein